MFFNTAALAIRSRPPRCSDRLFPAPFLKCSSSFECPLSLHWVPFHEETRRMLKNGTLAFTVIALWHLGNSEVARAEVSLATTSGQELGITLSKYRYTESDAAINN